MDIVVEAATYKVVHNLRCEMDTTGEELGAILGQKMKARFSLVSRPPKQRLERTRTVPHSAA